MSIVFTKTIVYGSLAIVTILAAGVAAIVVAVTR